MKWNSSLEIGIAAIDAQHMKIFELLLALENSVTKRDPWNIQVFFLSQIEEYLKFHLAVEEAMLEIIRYPNLSHHRNGHSAITSNIRELETELKKTHDGISGAKLVSFFESWFIRHVLADDHDYAAYAKKEFVTLFARPAAQG